MMKNGIISAESIEVHLLLEAINSVLYDIMWLFWLALKNYILLFHWNLSVILYL